MALHCGTHYITDCSRSLLLSSERVWLSFGWTQEVWQFRKPYGGGVCAMKRYCGTHYITDCSSSPFSSLQTNGSSTSNSSRSNMSLLLTRDVSARDFQSVVELYVIGVLIVFGMIANVMSIVVLKRYRERRDSLFLLQALAVVDCLYLAAAALRYPLKYLLTPGSNADPYVDMQPTVFPILKTFQVGTVVFHLNFSSFVCMSILFTHFVDGRSQSLSGI